jgi:L-amino acid N-acyltransferase YncA
VLAKILKMEIRFAQKKEVSQIIELCKEHADYERMNYERKNKSGLLSNFIFGKNPSLKCLVVEHENIIIGYATFMKQFSTWDADYYMYIDCLFLRETIRGKGFGRLIMERIKKYAKTENCSIIQWQTPGFNKKAIDFYCKIGGISKNKERFCLNV